VVICRSDFSETEKIIFRENLKERCFGNGKKIAFSWRPEKAIFSKPKKLVYRGDLKKRFFGERKNRFFVSN
jgi:hypothetical protein